MFEIYPWDEESERIFRKISSFGRANTNNVQLARDFSKRGQIRMLCNKNLLSISTNRRKRESWFNIPEDVTVSPVFKKNKMVFRFKRIF